MLSNAPVLVVKETVCRTLEHLTQEVPWASSGKLRRQESSAYLQKVTGRNSGCAKTRTVYLRPVPQVVQCAVLSGQVN